jgi:gamma-glutamylcyclotransferase (GGCT)/AIG2-like uncharacterized protein YtfP
MERERIFLYGTLRRGGTRDVETFYGGAEFLGAARVRGVLYDLGDYPGLSLSAGDGWVSGEVFDVMPEVLAKLDEWEGIDPESPDDGEYRRVRIAAELAGGGVESCWAYEIDAARCAGRSVISSGDWIAFEAARR